MLTAAAACWGVGTVMTKYSLGDVAPLTLLPMQLLVSVLLLLALTRIRNSSPLASSGWPRIAGLGVLNPGLAYALGLLGLQQITASLSVLLWALEPALIVVLARVVLGDRARATSYAALGVALLGVILVVYQPGASGSTVGIALVVAAVLACAVYTVLSRLVVTDEESLSVIIVQQIAALAFAIVVLVLVGMIRDGTARLDALSSRTGLAIVASGALYYGIAFWLYLAGLRRTTATFAGSFLTLIPVFGLAAASLTGESLAGHQWVGAVLVMASIAAILLVPSAAVGHGNGIQSQISANDRGGR